MINFGGTTNRVEDAKLEFVFTDYTGDVILTGDSIAMGGLVWDNSTSVDGQFTIGGAVTGKLTINLFNEGDALSIYDFRDSYLTAYLKMEGASNYTVMGQYFVGEFRYDGAMIALTAYDMMSKFDRPTSYLGNPAHTLTWPMTIKTMIQTACSICGVTLLHSTNPTPWDSYSITQKPQQWDSMTWHDVIAACAQISGTFAKIDAYGRLYFDWYNTSILSGTNEWDGGTFTGEAIPYADGDDLDGGTFDPWNTGDSADGGTFGDRANVHVIPSAYSLTVDTDDVVITGLKVTLEASDNIVQCESTQTYTTQLYGQDGYVITVGGNPFIETSANADAVKDFLGARVVGMMFRPLNASLIEDSTIEAGDVALIEGTNGNTYACFISHVTYTTNAATIISCDAESTGISSKVRFSMSDKIRNETEQIQRDVQAVKTISDITNQYFWFAESGVSQDVGTGAHITQIPQADFIADPEHGGGNLLARSNGIAIRDGATELAQFGTTVTLGETSSSHAEIAIDGMSIYNDNPSLCLDIGASDATASVPVVETMPPAGVSASSDVNANLTATRVVQSIPSYLNCSRLRFELLIVAIDTNTNEEEFIRDARWLDVSAGTTSFTINATFTSDQVVRTLNVEYNGLQNKITASVNDSTFFSVSSNRYEHIVTTKAPSFQYGSLAAGGSVGGYSATMGAFLNASSNYQFVTGIYNNNDSNNAFEIGNGTESDPSNALTVDWNGALTVADKVGTQHGIGIESGSVSITAAANNAASAQVTFSGVHSSAPLVVCGIESGAGGNWPTQVAVGCYSVTATDMYVRLWNSSSSSVTVKVNWIAIGS